MQLNNVLFPPPKFKYYYASNYLNEILLIPRNGTDSKIRKETDQFIPCLFLQPNIVHSKQGPSSNEQLNVNKILLFFHSNGEDIFLARHFANKICQSLKINVLIIEYPGYSLYNSEKSSEIILEDSLIVYDYIKKKYDIKDSNIYVIGRSIGTSPAIYLASKRDPGFLFVISAFTSIQAVAENLFGFLKIFLHERFTSIEYIKEVRCPVLFIHGLRDTMIPYKESIKLKKQCQAPFELIINEDMTHNEFDIEEDIIVPLQEFILKHKGNNIQDKKIDISYEKLPSFLLNKICPN